MWGIVLLLFTAVAASSAAPQAPAAPSKSAFIPAFDEIVVESSLHVKGRSGPTNPTQRQGRTKLLVVPTPGTPINGTSTSTSSSTSTTASTSTSTSAASPAEVDVAAVVASSKE